MALRARRIRLAAIATLTAFGVAASVAGAALVSVHTAQNSALGKILISASGRTLYHDSAEKAGAVKCTGTCAALWPPLLITPGAKAIAGPGVSAALLGTVKRPDGKVQVTYHGMALYLYTGDTKAGVANGQGSGGLWHAIAPSGVIVTKKAATTTAATSSGSKSSGSTGSTSGSSSGSTTTPGSGPATTTPNDCATNPGGYGCM